jgi:hypothetical protein
MRYREAFEFKPLHRAEDTLFGFLIGTFTPSSAIKQYYDVAAEICHITPS